MSYSQDALTRIFNVQWDEGAVFVYGTLTNLYCAKVAGKSIDHQTISLPGAGEFGVSVLASSFSVIIKNEGTPDEKRTPAFVVCGNSSEWVDVDDGAGNEIRLLRYHTYIYYSNDGLNWTVAFDHAGTMPSVTEPSNGANPVALVWDKKNNAFFYDQNDALKDQVFESSDGVSWAEVSSTPTEGADPDTYKSAFLPHCEGNDCFDERGHHVPDGVMSAPSAVTAKPVKPPIINYADGTSTVSFASGDPLETWGSGQVQVTEETVDSTGTKTVSVPGVPKVFCVAVSGSLIMAGGAADIAGENGAVAISLDLGVTWKTIAGHDSPVTTMVADARL
jgi:hypothetical protein